MPLPRFPRPGEIYEHLPYGEVRFETEMSSGAQPVLVYVCIRLDTGEEIIISEDEVVDITGPAFGNHSASDPPSLGRPGRALGSAASE